MPNSQRIGAMVTTLLVLVAALAPSAQAQVQTVARSADTALTGVVQDARGLPLLGAFVAVIALGADEPEAIVVTDGRGAFAVSGLTEGTYSLLVGSLGFTGTVLQGISVPSTAPVTLQLEATAERELSAFDAPLDLGYAMRTSKRDVLRQGEATLVAEDGTAREPLQVAAAPVARTVRPAFQMGGEVRLWSFTNVGDSQTVGVTSLNLSGANAWNLRAHVGHQGSVWSAGDFSQNLGGGHDMQVSFGYVGGGFQFLLPEDIEQRAGWIGRLQLQDTWSVSGPLEVRYGIRYEHHNYLARGELVSPAFEVSYELFDGTRVTSGAAMETTGLGLADNNGFEVMSVLDQAGVNFNDLGQVAPERTMRYHLGIEQLIGDAALRVRAYYDDTTDELLGVYVAGLNGGHNYLLFNVGDTQARGVEVGVAGQIVDIVTGEISYAYHERDTPYPLPASERFGSVAGADLDPAMTQTHEVNATLAAEVPTVRTFFEATYNWRHGLLVVRDGELRPDFGRFDLRVLQPLPFRAMQTEWSAMLQVRNLLGPEYDGLYNVSLAELVGLTRGIAGGLAVRF